MKLPNVPSEGLLQALPAEERKKLGKAGMTRAEAEEVFQRGQERELQRLINNELLRRGIYYVWHRMDKRTTTRKGTPDFIICCNGFLAVECKASGERLTGEQAREANRIRASGGRFVVAYNLQQVLDALKFIEP